MTDTKKSACSESNTIPADFPSIESLGTHITFIYFPFTLKRSGLTDVNVKHTSAFFFLWPLIWPTPFFIILVCAKTVNWLKTICVHLIHGWVLFHSVPNCSVSSNGWRHSTPFTSQWFTFKAKLLSEVFRNCQYKNLASLIYSLAIKAYQVSKHSNTVVPATQRK